MPTLRDAARSVLAAAAPDAKCRLTRQAAADWRAGRLDAIGGGPAPAAPARPQRPVLLPPKDMPRRSYGGTRGRIGLVHALAHIELNAIDLAWDLLARFADDATPAVHVDAWVRVAVDEADHFEALAGLLAGLGAAYGDLPAHAGLWEAADKTADDLLARLVVVPMTLEARGLDTTPGTIARLERGGDRMTPPVLEKILADEIEHVAAGLGWFRFEAERRGLDGAATYRRLMAERYPAGLKAPFNHDARARAGFPRDWYESVARP